MERCLPHAPMEDTEEGTENLQIVLPAGASRRAPASVRTFAEAPAASPTEDDWPHKEKATGEEANAQGKQREEDGGGESFVMSRL